MRREEVDDVQSALADGCEEGVSIFRLPCAIAAFQGAPAQFRLTLRVDAPIYSGAPVVISVLWYAVREGI